MRNLIYQTIKFIYVILFMYFTSWTILKLDDLKKYSSENNKQIYRYILLNLLFINTFIVLFIVYFFYSI